MLIKRIIANRHKIKLSNIKYYIEMLKEELKRFKYPLPVYRKLLVNYFKILRFRTLLKKSSKLHVGCGEVKIEGFINIDAIRTAATDFIAHIEDLPKYVLPNSIDFIYSSHMLEHLSRKDAVQVLKMYYDYLRPGGELRISVPDLKRLSSIADEQNLSFDEMDLIQGVLMGGQNTKYNYHKSVYWFDLLKHILEEIGFRNVKEDISSQRQPGNIQDASGFRVKDKLISLNVSAFKE